MISIPSYISSQQSSLIENTAIELLSILELGQSEALSKQTNVYVHYIPTTKNKDGCIALSFNLEENINRCFDDNGMPKLILKSKSPLVFLEPKILMPQKLFQFSSQTGMPSINETFKLTIDENIKKISGVLVRRYSGLRGCSNSSIPGWEKCPI